MRKIGLIAGGGGLPIALANHCLANDRAFFVLRLKGFADGPMSAFDGADVGIAELGRGIRLLRRAGCEAVCFAGLVARPDLANLKPDLRGLAALPGAVVAARRGDDGLLRFLVGEFEKEGFLVEGAHEVMDALTLSPGPLGAVVPTAIDLDDVERAIGILQAKAARLHDMVEESQARRDRLRGKLAELASAGDRAVRRR